MWFLGGVFWVVEGMWERFSSRDMIWSNQQEQPFWVIVISRRLSLLVSWGSKGTPSMPILLGGMALGEFLYIVRDPLGESPTATCKPTGRGLRKIRGELVVKLRACSCSYPVVKKRSAMKSEWHKYSPECSNWKLMVGRRLLSAGRFILRCYVSFREGSPSEFQCISGTS